MTLIFKNFNKDFCTKKRSGGLVVGVCLCDGRGGGAVCVN